MRPDGRAFINYMHISGTIRICLRVIHTTQTEYSFFYRPTAPFSTEVGRTSREVCIRRDARSKNTPRGLTGQRKLMGVFVDRASRRMYTSRDFLPTSVEKGSVGL